MSSQQDLPVSTSMHVYPLHHASPMHVFIVCVCVCVCLFVCLFFREGMFDCPNKMIFAPENTSCGAG